MKTIILTPQTKINAILVIDKKNKQIFNSTDLNMTLREYVLRADFSVITAGTFKMPNIYNHRLDYVMSGDGITTKGYKYKATAYKYEDKNKMIFVNVMEGIDQKHLAVSE